MQLCILNSQEKAAWTTMAIRESHSNFPQRPQKGRVRYLFIVFVFSKVALLGFVREYLEDIV